MIIMLELLRPIMILWKHLWKIVEDRCNIHRDIKHILNSSNTNLSIYNCLIIKISFLT